MKSLWIETSDPPHYPSLNESLSCDTLVIGGGISGLTAAFTLQNEGKKVVLVEKDKIAHGESGFTTAHLTVALDWRYHELISKFGEDDCRNVIHSIESAINFIQAKTMDMHVANFKRVEAFLFSEDKEGAEDIEKESQATQKLGLDTFLLGSSTPESRIIDLPFKTQAALRFSDQAQFHPVQYMHALAKSFINAGGRIFEDTLVSNIEDGRPCIVQTKKGEIKANEVLVLTNTPISTRVALHTKISNYRTYAIAFKAPKLKGLYWDTNDPYHYIRSQRIGDSDYLIIGGEDHKTGQDTLTVKHFDLLESYAKKFTSHLEAPYHWSGQVVETVDGLPYIGLNPGSDHVYTATGFSGNGMTFGTLSGLMLKDFVLMGESLYKDIYDPDRISPIAGVTQFLKENANAGMYMLRDWLRNDEKLSPTSLKKGDGGIFEFNGKKIAAFRDDDGALHLHSAVCPHLKGVVHWNAAEKSFDCPLHGSRFDACGKVLNGPAKSALENIADPFYKQPPRAASQQANQPLKRRE